MNNIPKIKEVLTTLCSLPGVSGYETPVSDALKGIWGELTDEVQTSRLGNLYALKKATEPSEGPRRKVLFAVHMDAVGMIVTELVGEFIRFEEMGGLDPRILPGQFVTIHTKTGPVKGLIVMPGRNLTKTDHGREPIPLPELLIDTGYDAETLKTLVRPGDIISYGNDPVFLQDDTIAAHTLDNRASIAAVTACLQELQSIRHKWDVYAVGTVQEEVSMVAASAPFDIRPDIAVAIDVTFAKGPGAKDWFTCPLGSGAAIGFGMNMHPKLSEIFRDICEEEHIPYTAEFSPGMSGTDAWPMQVAAGGFPTGLISIPLRYMHTANEVIDMKDVDSVGHLLAAFVRGLDEHSMDQLAWED